MFSEPLERFEPVTRNQRVTDAQRRGFSEPEKPPEVYALRVTAEKPLFARLNRGEGQPQDPSSNGFLQEAREGRGVKNERSPREHGIFYQKLANLLWHCVVLGRS